MDMREVEVSSKIIKNYSVLMSVYCREKPEWLDISINSMLCQTIRPEEFLIVKDGPLTHELDAIIANYVESNPGLFTVIAIEKNGGLGPALALGVTKCRNELIIRMDSDDYSVPTRCEKLLDTLELHPECDVIGSYEVEFEERIENAVSIHRVPVNSEEISSFMKKRCALLHPTVLYKQSSVKKAGNYKSIKMYEDYELFMRMILVCGMKAFNIPENLYYIRINNDFFERRGGWEYMNTAVKFKYAQLKKHNISKKDFIISAGGQAVVCLMPNVLRKWFYLKFLRK